MEVLQYIKPIFTGHVLTPEHPTIWWILGVAADFLMMGTILFFLLKLVPSRSRKMMIIILTFLAGLIYSVEYFWPPHPFLGNFITQTGKVTNVVYAFALGLGVYSLVRFHGNNLLRLKPGWYNNLAFFISFLTVLSVALWYYYSPGVLSENAFQMLFWGVVTALGATMFSTIGFYIISAAYRAFRIRSVEATLMLSAAFIVMLGQVPIGFHITSGLPEQGMASMLRLENMKDWILQNPNMSAWRGMAFGIEIGALAMALRTWLSLERGSFFEREL